MHSLDKENYLKIVRPIIKDIPSVGLTIAPYLITIIVLVGFIGKSEGPAANGKNYVKSK